MNIKIRHIINGTIWTIFGLYLLLIILLHVPFIQGYLGDEVASALSQKFGTKVYVGRVDLGFMNRIIIDDVMMNDQKGKQMIKVVRLSAKFDILPLTQSKISISSVQIFGFHGIFYKPNTIADANYQFVLDSLASKDTTKKSNLNLRINSIIIRHGYLTYDKLDVAPTYNRLNPSHLNINNISAHVILKTLTNDSLNVHVKKLAFNEKSGFILNKLSFKFIANKKRAKLSDFILMMPNTKITINNTEATYKYINKKIAPASLQFNGKINTSTITPCDLKCLIPQLSKFKSSIQTYIAFYGTSTSIRISDIKISSLNGNIDLAANGSISEMDYRPRWFANIKDISLSAKTIDFISKNLNGTKINIPSVISRLGDIRYKGIVGGVSHNFATQGILKSDAGNANIAFGLSNGNKFTGRIETKDIDLKKILANNKFGKVVTDINVDGNLRNKKLNSLKLKGNIQRFDYNQYTYHNINIDGIYNNSGTFDGLVSMNDANGKISINGKFNTKNNTGMKIKAEIHNFNPSAFKITNKFNGAKFDLSMSANIFGKNIEKSSGQIDINNFSMRTNNDSYKMNNMHIETGIEQYNRFIKIKSDFAEMNITGQYSYATILQSLTNFIGSKLPTIPGLPKTNKQNDNNFNINATITRSDWLNKIFNIPLTLDMPLTINGNMNDKNHKLNLKCDIPSFSYKDSYYRNGYIDITTPNDTLKANIGIRKIMDNGHKTDININANAINNILASKIHWTNNLRHLYSGTLNAETHFFRNQKGLSAAHVSLKPSEIVINDTSWTVKPSTLIYSKNNLDINKFTIERGQQHLIVSGIASPNIKDSIFIDLHDINIAYILNLVNFHSVDFGGLATGRAYIASAFSAPSLFANLKVNNFKFEDGRMGTLFADVKYNKHLKQIDINAKADDGLMCQTLIKGYVSPARNYIDLGIHARGTNAEFAKSFCGSFMSSIDASANGDLRIVGPLSTIQLVGMLTLDGKMTMRQLGTTYSMKNDTIKFIPDEIELRHAPVYDKDNHVGYLTGNIHHKHLTHLSYDLDVDARNLLCYDQKEFGDNTFCGTVYGTGKAAIHGKSGEVSIDMNITPNKNSIFTYNTASSTSVSSDQFIHWNDNTKEETNNDQWADNDEEDLPDIPTNIYLNFLINCTQDATIKVIMDQKTNDYIALNGDGTIRATYYNKGAFDMFGTYNVDHGIYKLTIQDVIKKDFQFQQGGTIIFGGNPYDAALNLKAQYTVNGVSLSDLNIGKSFSSNTIRVNCLMNITGNPKQPKVDFDLDLPTVNTDEKQMVRSIINSQEDMNQQVLYLLGIGRFYTQGSNNAIAEEAAQQNQTTLAMQSLLSGTISSQINSVLSSVLNNHNWNFGANISTGTEGWNNAEYEGLLSGRLLNNRLLINGQFGYRDNAATANNSFIGDFDIRYLLYPNGNLAIKVYNQTNDRYFTKSSLNTQGLGLIMKKDFNGLKELFSHKKTHKKNIKKSTKKE